MKCRHCGTSLSNVFLDLGYAPPSNAYLTFADFKKPEKYFPLKIYVCHKCWLVQTEDYALREELFTDDYAYFSSVSSSWLEHALHYTDIITNRLNLNNDSFVIEVASNDGYLLKNFIARGIPCLGIEPADGTAQEAEKKGIPTIRNFFGVDLAKKLVQQGKQADLIIGNNVYAHVPDINDFTAGLKKTLKPNGTITLEFPHLLNLIRLNQFDTVYHEHYSYLSLQTVALIFEKFGLRVFDVEKLNTHGGSLRVYGCHDDDSRPNCSQVKKLLEEENRAGMKNMDIYLTFQLKANKIKDDLLAFLIKQKQDGKKVGAYGAAAKGNTLLNYTCVKPDLVSFVCDAAPSKQGKFMPGSHIPILPPIALVEERPDWVIILPWNISKEVLHQYSIIKEWGGQFIVAVPKLKILK